MFVLKNQVTGEFVTSTDGYVVSFPKGALGITQQHHVGLGDELVECTVIPVEEYEEIITAAKQLEALRVSLETAYSSLRQKQGRIAQLEADLVRTKHRAEAFRDVVDQALRDGHTSEATCTSCWYSH